MGILNRLSLPRWPRRDVAQERVSQAAIPDSDEFIETQASFQFGACRAERGLNLPELASRIARRRGFLVLHNPSEQSFVPSERGADLRYDAETGWQSGANGNQAAFSELIRPGRYADQLNELLAAGLRSPVIMDMQDAVRAANDEFPCFQYVRRHGAPNSILWPLPRVHGLESSEFCKPLDPEESKFKDKKPLLFWRGVMRGFSTFGGKRTNIKFVIKQYIEGQVGRDFLVAHLQTVPRYIFVSRYFNKPGFDVGFIAPKRFQKVKRVEDIEQYRKPRAAHADFVQCRYQISIGGTDVGTSFGWQVGTNCVLLKEDYPWEVFFDCHFRAGRDYLSAAQDFSGLEKTIAWCEDNLDACQAMIESRQRVVPFLVDPAILREVKRRVVSRYETFYQDHAG